MAAHNIPQAEENPEQHHDNEKSAEQLAIAQHKLEFAFVIPRHILDDYPSPSFPSVHWLGGPPATLSSARPKEVSISRGSGNTMVVFFSAPISTSVCR